MLNDNLKHYNDDTFKNKGIFVKEVIEPLINYCNTGWKFADYICDEAKDTEFIRLSTLGGAEKFINVHIDSLSAMIIDVMSSI